MVIAWRCWLGIGLLLLVVSCGGGDKLVDLPKYNEMKNITEAPTPLRTAASAIVKIVLPDGSSGTASFISTDGQLLTNNHVLGIDESACAAEGCYVKIYRHYQVGSPIESAQEVFAEPLRVSPELDAAIYQLWTDSSKRQKIHAEHALDILPLSSGELHGKTVYVIGHPRGGLKKWTSGQVYGSSRDWIQTTNFSLRGNSGSPFLDEQGRIVGIVHRGPTDISLITKHDALYQSTGTSGQALAKFRDTPVSTGLFFSIRSPHTTQDIANHQISYLMGHLSDATTADGTKLPVVDSLGLACDRALENHSFSSPDDLENQIAPCSAARRWLNCKNLSDGAGYKVCPMSEKANKWHDRFVAAAEKVRLFNGYSFYSWLVTPVLLEHSNGEATHTENTLLLNYTGSANPPLDHELAYYLLEGADGRTKYQGIDVADFIINYRNHAQYEFQYSWIIYGHGLLYQEHIITRAEFGHAINAMFGDDRLDLGSKLSLEEFAYNYGFL